MLTYIFTAKHIHFSSSFPLYRCGTVYTVHVPHSIFFPANVLGMCGWGIVHEKLKQSAYQTHKTNF